MKILIPFSDVTEKELECLRLFKRRATQLENNSLILNGYESGVDIQMGQQGHALSIKSLPPEEAFRSLLLEFRHFWAVQEDCRFLRILKIIDRHVPGARVFTAELKSLWNQALFHRSHLVLDGKVLISEQIIDLWINAEYFHNDLTKRSELRNLISTLEPLGSGDFAKWLLIGSICERCNVIMKLNRALDEI
ncbi:MAG: hypothetical protein ABL925_20865 [Methylococcales bacterium]